jgi:hypothetical protein
LVDYEAALDKDFKRPVTLLGAGLTHVRLGDLDQALPMLEYAMELLDREEIEPVEYSPQLTELATRAAEILDPIFKPKIPG